MLVDKLRMSIASKQEAEVVEPGDDALQFDAIDQKDGQRRFGLPDVIKKGVL